GIEVEQREKNAWSVRVTVRNTGDRAGAEVVQLYVASQTPHVARPVHELRAFEKVHLDPGEATTIEFAVTPRDLAFWNARHSRWQIAPGEYRFEVGASSRDIRVSASVTTSGDGIVDALRMDSTLGEWAAHPVSAAAIA